MVIQLCTLVLPRHNIYIYTHDPLSPSSFILVMEGPSKLFSKTVHLSWMKGYAADHRGDLNTSHILYSYDTLISCEAEEQQVLFFRMITGRHINFSKTFQFPVDIVPNIK